MNANNEPRKQRSTINKALFDLVLRMCYDQNCSMKQISNTLNLDRKTISRLLKAHVEGQKFIDSKEKRKSTWEKKTATLQDSDQALYNAVACNNDLTLKEISQIATTSTNHVFSVSTVSRKLKKMNITRKRLSLVPIERNTIARKNERAVYASEISMVSDSNMIFLDETGFNEHSRRSYGYSLRNHKAYAVVPANRNINTSFLCAIGTSGIIAYQYKRGAFNSNDFVLFINEKLKPYFRSNPSKVLIMDNARFHKATSVIELLRSSNIAFKFLVPYSPQLNPIEEFFSMIKSRFYSLKNLEPEKSIIDCLGQILSQNNDFSDSCRNFFNNMRGWLEKARQHEDFI